MKIFEKKLQTEKFIIGWEQNTCTTEDYREVP